MNTFDRDAIRKEDVIIFKGKGKESGTMIQARVTRRFRDGKLSIEQQFSIDPDNGEPVVPLFGPIAKIYLSDVQGVLSRGEGRRA